jgi:hypothetical protein
MLLVTLGSLGLAGWWWHDTVAFDEETARLEAATARTAALIAQATERMSHDGLTFSAEQMAHVRTEVAFLNHLADKRGFSWLRFLKDLEETVPMPVAVSSVKVNFQESTVALTGVAEDLPSLNRFVTQLQNHAAFRTATLVSQHLRDDEATKGGHLSYETAVRRANEIEFSLAVQYRLRTDGID